MPYIEGFAQLSLACATCFFAELDGEPIATAALFMHEGTALLAGASTIPKGRRMGAQNALLNTRLHTAASNNCDLCDDGGRTGELVAAQCRAAGIQDRLHKNEVDARRLKPLIVLIAVLMLAPADAAAQSTRVVAIAEEQAEKAKRLGVEGPSEAERSSGRCCCRRS
jgi:hypothetical protein